jgi:hypothetical protein
MQCFVDYIGFFYCPGGGVYDSPPSGLYINSLPGISIENTQKIADSEQITYIGVWSDVQRFALAQFRMDILVEMKKCWQLNKECDYDALICDNVEELATAWKYLLGVTLMIFRLNSDRINRWTTIGRDEAKELRDFYQVKYEEALNQGVLLMDTDECCLVCEPNPSIVSYLP